MLRLGAARLARVPWQVFQTQRCCIRTSSKLYQLSDFQTNKLMSEFDRFYDRDGDGFVCKKDIEILKSQMTQFSATMKGKAARDLEGHGYDDFWVLFREIADTNKDGRLSREEWVDIWTKIDKKADSVKFSTLPQWLRLMIFTLFPLIDTKGDGHIDLDEYKHFWYELSGTTADSQTLNKMFSAMTEGGEKKIDATRFQELYADYYLSKDTSSPGKYITGPVEIN